MCSGTTWDFALWRPFGRPASELADAAPVQAEIRKAVARVNRQLAPFEQVRKYRVLPRELSFKGALQALLAFAPHVVVAPRGQWPALAERIRAAIAQQRVADRPDRYEPRARKRRLDNYQHLQRPRAEAKARLRRGVCE